MRVGEQNVLDISARGFFNVFPPLYTIRWTLRAEGSWSGWADRAYHVRQFAKVYGNDLSVAFVFEGKESVSDA